MKRPLVKKKSRQSKPRRSKPTAELLFEIGMEELPFEFVAPALMALRESASRLFQDARLSCGSITTYGTPRRLVLVVDELLAHQTAVVKETMGPSKAVAFDQAGQPTKAAMGFAAGQARCRMQDDNDSSGITLSPFSNAVFPESHEVERHRRTLCQAGSMDRGTIRGNGRAGPDCQDSGR
jgi:hypothetical protein